MNLVTRENLFITGFVLIIVVGIQYVMYLELTKKINKRLNQINHKIIVESKQAHLGSNQVKLETKQVNPANPANPVNPANKSSSTITNQIKKDTSDDDSTLDNDEDLDSNIDSYVNPLPSVNNDESDEE